MLLIMLRTRTWHHLEAVGFLHQETEHFLADLKRFNIRICVIKLKTQKKRKKVIVRIMKIGENCEESSVI
jgi:hypothetical protein